MAPEDIVCNVFGVDRSTVDDESSNRNVPGWDSMGHITLVLELEAAYGVSLSAEDALAMTDVAAIKRVLTTRGARW